MDRRLKAYMYGSLAVLIGALGGTVVFAVFFRDSPGFVWVACFLLTTAVVGVVFDRLLFTRLAHPSHAKRPPR